MIPTKQKPPGTKDNVRHISTTPSSLPDSLFGLDCQCGIIGDGNIHYQSDQHGEAIQCDECKNWSDKAAALASYARQAKDDSLRVMAVRIQARAQRRCGELLKLIPRADEATRYGQVVAHPPMTRTQAEDAKQDSSAPPLTRTQAATDAGLSEHQRKTA